MVKKMCLLYIFLLKIITANTQNTIGLPRILNFSNNSYEGGAQTWDIKQDAGGRMYFANNEGLLTYDGNYWKLYPQPNKTILRSIALDNNRIYAGGQDELGYYSPNEKGILQYHTLKNLIPKEYSSFTDVWEIEIYEKSVFFRTWDRIFEYNNGTIRIYPAATGWQMMKRTANKLIACDKKKGLFQFIRDRWEPMSAEFSIIPFEITGIAELNNDSLMVSSLQDGLFIYYKGKLTKKVTGADNSFLKSHIYAFEQINNSEFVAGTTSEGCIVINSNGELVQQISRPEGLQNNNVLSVFLDKDHNLWAGLDNGISFIAYNSAIKYIKPGKPDELSGYSARVFNNQFYVATSDGAYVAGLSNNAKDLSFSKSNFQKIKNTDGQCWRLDEINNQLLLGHHKGSFVIHQYEASQLTANGGAWIFLPTSSVFPSPNVLFGTYNGLSVLKYDNGIFSSSGDLKGMNESLRFMAIDNNNVIWASHPYRGIYRITLSADQHSFNYELFTEKDGLPSTLHNNVFRIKNRVMFTTDRGVYEYDAASKRFIQSPLLYNVFGDMVMQYLNEDADGNVWFCTGKKIGVVSFEEEKNLHTVTYFPELTGKILSGFESVYPYNKENIFIASTSGIIHLNFKKYIIADAKPTVLLTQVKMSGKNDSLVFGGYFNQSLDSMHRLADNAGLNFRNKDNSFHFEFSSPGLQSNISYSYQLKGYDKNWSVPASKTEKEYTNLPEGHYTFFVKAYDNLGNESAPVSYSFVIKAAWYQTIWAYFAYGIILIACIYFYIKCS